MYAGESAAAILTEHKQTCNDSMQARKKLDTEMKTKEISRANPHKKEQKHG